jgi:hypothetical protein
MYKDSPCTLYHCACSCSKSIITWAVDKKKKNLKKKPHNNNIWCGNNVCPIHIVLRTHLKHLYQNGA